MREVRAFLRAGAAVFGFVFVFGFDAARAAAPAPVFAVRPGFSAAAAEREEVRPVRAASDPAFAAGPPFGGRAVEACGAAGALLEARALPAAEDFAAPFAGAADRAFPAGLAVVRAASDPVFAAGPPFGGCAVEACGAAGALVEARALPVAEDFAAPAAPAAPFAGAADRAFPAGLAVVRAASDPVFAAGPPFGARAVEACGAAAAALVEARALPVAGDFAAPAAPFAGAADRAFAAGLAATAAFPLAAPAFPEPGTAPPPPVLAGGEAALLVLPAFVLGAGEALRRETAFAAVLPAVDPAAGWSAAAGAAEAAGRPAFVFSLSLRAERAAVFPVIATAVSESKVAQERRRGK